ncbi:MULTISPECIES: multiubiquitin domain-containing protein [Bradyrhizobium]|uniref:Multiubiquitin domain-containing protein n=2 Tax=Bradyrhizobium TaxID=374 RepID=A0A7Z0QCM6_9BRAD|nr:MULTISPECIES: multiubiquitin domain-containing protein [Bradyrhizobium]MBR1292437.1 multiubiquitin domain-containing protein [Bradyrhizobium ottawaense]UGX92618.1 multiubiquitin domain-containing protein [Bradyrhizobium barranii subsp. barranii]WLB47599.1 multiubiquitin domain-containing protein [Bradyrhizobium ottawaense]WLB52750.1 multiubiquitin domain-containing protein [Bradyrhizobium japonicum]WLB65397.1 multiubiquitin domain-containing protein [Bradyrhizobium japonicum]
MFGREAALGDDNRGEQMGDKQNAHQETYFFFVGGKKYETDQPALTGLQIKARVADWDSSHDLVLEGHGNDPDRIIGDDERVSLDKDKGPLRFSSAPKANFG